jgi:alkaline phosphatase D
MANLGEPTYKGLRRRSLLKSASFAFLGLLTKPFPALAQENRKTLRKITFGSCAFQWEPQTIWSAINDKKPDLFLFLGDAIYGDWHGDKPFTPTEAGLKADWQKLADQPGLVELRKTTPVMATWDNHDYGSHNGGAEFELKEMTKRLFLDFLDEPADSARRKRPGVYDAKAFGEAGRHVQIILLDTKTFRSVKH